MTPDTITVVIPTYNRAAMVQRAIASVLNETRVPIRVYVLDNASTDETPDVLARLAAQDSRPVPYKHLTPPTHREVQIAGGAGT